MKSRLGVRRLLAIAGVLAGLTLFAQPSAAQVKLMGTLGSHLVEVNPGNSSLTVIGNTGYTDITALTYNPVTGRLLAIAYVASDPRLIDIDPATGAATMIGAIEFDAGHDEIHLAEALAYDFEEGKLFAAISYGGPSQQDTSSEMLVEIDQATGTATFLTKITPTPQDDGDALVSIDGTLYVADVVVYENRPLLFSVNPETGAVSYLWDLPIVHIADLAYDRGTSWVYFFGQENSNEAQTLFRMDSSAPSYDVLGTIEKPEGLQDQSLTSIAVVRHSGCLQLEERLLFGESDRHENDPQLSGEQVVFWGNLSPIAAGWDIFLGDVTTGSFVNISNTQPFPSVFAFEPDIDDARLVYVRQEWIDDESFYDVVIYELITGEATVIPGPFNDRRPRISGDHVVFAMLRYDWDIYGYEISTGTVFPIDQRPGDQYRAEISNGRIVYVSDGIWLFDIATGTWEQIDTEGQQPHIEGNRVVYSKYASSETGFDVFLYEIGSGAPPRNISNRSGKDINPKISKNYVAYQKPVEADLDHLFLYLINEDRTVQVTHTGGSFANFGIENGRIVYNDFRNFSVSGADIYMTEVTISACPPAIDVVPLNYNFGEVEIGASSSVIVTVSNKGDLDLNIQSASIEGSLDFTLLVSGTLPTVIASQGTVDLEITYAPVAEGLSIADLIIISNDPEDAVIKVPLNGTGVKDEPPPSEQVAYILEKSNQWVEQGDLQGEGPGSSAAGRLNALLNMIEAAGDLIDEGFFGEACQQLSDAYNRCDSEPSPPDFVTADARADLAQLIRELMASLGCE